MTLTPTPRMFAPLDSNTRRISPQSIGIATALNVSILLLALLMRNALGSHPLPYSETFPPQSLTLPAELLLKSAADLASGGGSNTGVAPASQGNPPRFSAEQLNPPKLPPIDDPKLAIAPTIDTHIVMARTDLSNLGLPSSTMPSASLGKDGGHGVGNGGPGDGYGPGSDRGTGGGDHYAAGGGHVVGPQVLYAPEPEFSEEARKQKLSGDVLVALEVDSAGHPTKIHVIRSLGAGLDEKAIEAVSRYRFKPATQNGHPIAVPMNVSVNFQIF